MKKAISRGLLACLAGMFLLTLSPLALAGGKQPLDFKAYLAAWSHDLEKLMTYFPEDVVYEDAALGVVNHNKTELRKFASDFFTAFPDTHFEFISAVVSGNHAAVEWVMSGTQTGDMPNMPASNKKMSVRGVSVMEIRNGKVVHDVDYWDFATFRRQLGFEK